MAAGALFAFNVDCAWQSRSTGATMWTTKRTILMALMAVLIVLAIQGLRVMVRRASGQELAPAERTALINSTRQSCERDPSVARIAKEEVLKYCDCYAQEVAKLITKNDLSKTSITPDLQRKIEIAGTECLPR